MLTGYKLYLAIAIIFSITLLTRAIPFIIFDKEGKSPPNIILYLGKYLPPAIISCILVYCFKDINFSQSPFGLRELISASVVVILHFVKGNAMLSILSGTIIYMIFTQIGNF